MTETTKFTIELPEDVAAKLKAEAETTDASASTVINYALQEYLLEQQQARDFALEDACQE